jgi:integrase
MNANDWNTAQESARKWIADGQAIDTSSGPDPPPEPVPPAPMPQDEPISVEQAWEKFVARVKNRNLSSSTIYKHKQLQRQMCSFAQRHSLRFLKEFSLDLLEEFQGQWAEGALARSKKVERLRGFFRVAVSRGWLTHNPSKDLQGPEVKPRPTLPFSHEQMRSILDAVSVYPDKSGRTGGANAVRLRAFVLMLRYTGLRIGDVTRLNTDQLAGNKVFLYTQKTGQPVSCVLPEFVAKALEIAPRLSERYFFWTGCSTLHTAIGTWQRTLRKLFKLAGIQKGYAHRFRDTFAVELLLAGVPTEEVAVLLGHSNIGITQKHYSPWVRSRQLQLEANLERAWSRDPIVLLNVKDKSSVHGQGGGLPN